MKYDSGGRISSVGQNSERPFAKQRRISIIMLSALLLLGGIAMAAVSGCGSSVLQDITGVTFDNAEYISDYLFHLDNKTVWNIEVSGDIPKGVHVAYSVNGEPFTGAYIPGVYEVTATLIGDEYNPLTLTAKLIIASSDLQFTAIDGGKGYSVAQGSAYAFNNELVLPSRYYGLPVTQIAIRGFSDHSSVKSIWLPDTLTIIGDYAFNGCSNLTDIKIPDNVTAIGNSAFSFCSALTSITMPASVTSIGVGAFRHCNALRNITIPDSVTTIGGLALEDTAWYKAQADGLIYVNRVLYGYKGTMAADTAVTILPGTVSIAGNAFYNCTALTSITIPDSVTSNTHARTYLK